MKDYMMYNGNEGIFTYTYQNERKSKCSVCQQPYPSVIKCDRKETLSDLLQKVPKNKYFKKNINQSIEEPFVKGRYLIFYIKKK
jgi:hypothetical protein